MDLRNLVLRGFSTFELCRGGDEKAQDPKWLGAKAQGVLLDRMRRLAIEVEAVDCDETLSDMGKTKKRAELGQAALAEIEGSIATIRGGAIMPHYRYQHVPGIDMLTEQNHEVLTIKQCSSVASQLGRKRVLSELYGCTSWD